MKTEMVMTLFDSWFTLIYWCCLDLLVVSFVQPNENSSYAAFFELFLHSFYMCEKYKMKISFPLFIRTTLRDHTDVCMCTCFILCESIRHGLWTRMKWCWEFKAKHSIAMWSNVKTSQRMEKAKQTGSYCQALFY